MSRRIVKIYRDDDNEIDRLMAEAQKRDEYYDDYFWDDCCPECGGDLSADVPGEGYGWNDGFHEIWQIVCDGCHFSIIKESVNDWSFYN
ncbi:MAG TPA: hypothetical protein VIK14_17775 [Ignavibacteria bacterium]